MVTQTTDSAPESQLNEKLRKGSPVNMILLFLVIGLVAYGLFLSFDKGRVMTKTTDLENETKQIQSEIDQIRGNKVEVSQNASEAMKKIQSEEIRWSEVISQVNTLIPQDSAGRKTAEILSYSGSGNGRIAVNMVTRSAGSAPFEDVSRLIAAFNNSVFFKDVYVPSISKGSLEDGSTTLSFVLNMEYQKQETGSDDLTISVGNTTTRVPRVNAPVNN